jgi:hypothetical protein
MTDRACEGGETRTLRNAMGDMEECIVCRTAVAWDLVDHPFFGFSAGCGLAREALERVAPR